MLLHQWKPIQVHWCNVASRCMCNSVESSVQDGSSQKKAYIEQMAARQNETNEKPANWDIAKPYNQMPGPKAVPIFGNVWRFLPVIGTYYGLDQISLHSRFSNEFGKIVKLSDIKVRNDLVILFDPEDIEMCYRNEGVWPHRRGFGSIKHYKLKMREDIFEGEEGILTSQGVKWYHARTIVNPPMMQPKSAQMYIGTIDEVTQDFMERIRFLESRHPEGQMPKDFKTELQKWSLESICTIGLNKRLDLFKPNVLPKNDSEQFLNDIFDMFHLQNELDIKPSLWKWYNTGNWKKYVNTLNRIANFQLKYINEAIQKIENNNVDKSEPEMSILEQLLKRDRKVAFAMVFDMFLAGIDTTSNTSAAALYFLCTNQKAQEKLREECRNVLPHKHSPITKEVLNNMPYLKAVIKETTRLAPVSIGSFRKTPKDMVLSGYQIPKGTAILNSHMYLCRQEKYFPRANDFIPERWLRQGRVEYQSADANPFVFMPFGFGPRSCVARRLAQLEIEVLLVKIFRNFSMTWPHEEMQWVMKMLYGVGSPLEYNVKSLKD